MELEQIKNIIDKVVGFDIATKKRQIEYVDARRIFYKIARTKTKHSFSSIGKCLNRDHATALHGVKQFDILINQNEFLKYLNPGLTRNHNNETELLPRVYLKKPGQEF